MASDLLSPNQDTVWVFLFLAAWKPTTWPRPGDSIEVPGGYFAAMELSESPNSCNILFYRHANYGRNLVLGTV